MCHRNGLRRPDKTCQKCPATAIKNNSILSFQDPCLSCWNNFGEQQLEQEQKDGEEPEKKIMSHVSGGSTGQVSFAFLNEPSSHPAGVGGQESLPQTHFVKFQH